MEGYSRKDPQLLDLIPKDSECFVAKRAEEEATRHHGVSEEKKLELSLGPPGGGDYWTITKTSNESLLSFPTYFSTNPCVKSPWQHQTFLHHLQSAAQLPLPAMKESPPQPCTNRAAAVELQSAEKKKAFSPAPANTAVHNTSSAQKRTAPAPVVGWPPIRSFRKNIATGSSSKLASESPNAAADKDSGPKPAENSPRTLFVKINMDGIPIGRKVDLKAYNSYEKLACAVDELFRGLVAAQSEVCAGGIKDDEGGKGKVIGGLLDGSGEYTLVYEDNEGDRMLVGDVPWHMFVSTVRRLRVLKSSELPRLSRGSKEGKLSLNA
ncbi:auxin-responsive protein IAA26 [Sesamum indicum]|uniref:Auxin-responsive protein n=1 Tax=Sesamum indicum TaxID=4182 RepID=A0A6I9SXQ6_SESIN|nr:auxin-responsive protein IAA26 [Sesamum indicum]